MKAQSPAFSFYPKDILSDEAVAAMTHEELGIYTRLLCHAWLEGSIPADIGRLARMAKLRRPDFEKIWPAIAPCWKKSPEDQARLIQGRLETEREKQRAYSLKQSNRAKGKKKPRKSKVSTKDDSHGSAAGQPETSRIEAGSSLPSPSPSPSPSPENGRTENDLVALARDGGPPSAEVGRELNEGIERVFQTWRLRTGHHRAVLTPQRRRHILARLREEPGDVGAKVAGLERAVEGAVSDPFFNGSEKGRSYLGFESIFVHQGRDRIEKLQRLADSPERARAGPEVGGRAARIDAKVAANLERARLAELQSGEGDR